jgi:hypothetical protein
MLLKAPAFEHPEPISTPSRLPPPPALALYRQRSVEHTSALLSAVETAGGVLVKSGRRASVVEPRSSSLGVLPPGASPQPPRPLLRQHHASPSSGQPCSLGQRRLLHDLAHFCRPLRTLARPPAAHRPAVIPARKGATHGAGGLAVEHACAGQGVRRAGGLALGGGRGGPGGPRLENTRAPRLATTQTKIKGGWEHETLTNAQPQRTRYTRTTMRVSSTSIMTHRYR